MNLRDALNFCTDEHLDDWVEVPGNRPATAMVAGMFDPGASEPNTRPLAGHSIAVYEPDARLSLVWPVPDDHEDDQRFHGKPDWAEQDSHEWKHTRYGWAVVLLSGTPIWQTPMWYLDWAPAPAATFPTSKQSTVTTTMRACP